MRPVWARSWTEFRAHWFAWLLLVVVVAVGSGVSMALFAGARRTDQAYVNFSQRNNAADVIVAGSQAFGFVGSVNLDQVEHLPDVASSARVFAPIVFTGTTDRGQSVGPSDIFPVASRRNDLGHTIEAWKLLQGRAADPSRIDEAVASFDLASALHLRVGSTIELHFFEAKTFLANVAAKLLSQFPERIAHGGGESSFAQMADGPDIRVHIVGIEASPAEFPPRLLDISPILHLTPAFYGAYAGSLVGSPISYVRLHHHDAMEPFKAAVERAASGKPVSFISTRTIQAQKVQRSIRVEATALAIVGALIAITFLVVIIQSLTRNALIEAGDHATLRALGMTPRQLTAITLFRCLATGLAGVALGCALAVIVSPYVLLGLARKAELHTGIYVDPVVLITGASAFLVVIIGTSLVAGRLARRRALPASMRGTERPRPGVLTRLAGSVSLPPAPSVGLRFAIRNDRNSPGVPVWTTIVGATVTIALLVATWSFTASLRHVIDTPHDYGENWDLRVGAPALPDIGGSIVPALSKDQAIVGLSAGTVTQALVRGQRFDILALQRNEGVVEPTFIAGHAPTRNDEIALGARTMRSLHVKLGDVVNASIGDANASYKVVGQAVFPEFGDAGQLGTGGFTTLGAIDQLLPGAPRNIFFIRFRPGTNIASDRARISDALEPLPHRVEGHPADLANLERVSALPALFSTILVGLVIVLLVHTLVTGVRRRRREVAVLEALGFVRRQVRGSIVTAALVLIGISLLIGIPIGILAGRLVWKVFASSLGLASQPVIPVPVILSAVVAAFAIALFAALVPAWFATRQRPSTQLRLAE